MVNMPPGSAKSTYGSKLFPAWLLAQKPDTDIIGAANVASLAETFSRAVMGYARDMAPELGYRLTREAVADWTTSNGGAYRAIGMEGTIAGRRADFALIDDPVKDSMTAYNEGEREKQWTWFTNDLRSRLKPGAAIVVIMTRWHEDDLGGRCLTRQAGMWDVVSIPAMAMDNDLLGRAPGEWLWDGDPAYAYGADLRAKRREAEIDGSMRNFEALYQQNPRPGEGALFKVAAISDFMDETPTGTSVRAWDLAATKDIGTANPDWTVGIRMTKLNTGRFAVVDRVRLRGGPDEVEARILQTAALDGNRVRIGLPQDPGQAGKSQVAYLTTKLTGYTVISSPETGDKATRAAPFASQVNVGNVSMVRADWNASYLDELAAFPAGSKDDQVDASSRAFGLLSEPIAARARSADISFMPR